MTDVKSETSAMYTFLAWLEPYIQPRRSTTNLVVMEDVRGNDTEEEVVELDNTSTRSSTPEPKFVPVSATTDPLPRSKVTGRPKYMHGKRPRVTEGADVEFLKTVGHHLINKDNQRDLKDEESLFGELIASQLRKLTNQERLTAKMEIL